MSKPLGLIGVILVTGLGLALASPGMAAEAATPPPHAPTMRPVQWVGKTADWTDPGNWSGGAVPTADDIAVFDQRADKIVHQPNVAGTVTVGGIVFASGGGKLKPNLAGAKKGKLRIAPATWTITGTGTIVLGAGGITTTGTHVIYPGVELAGPQTWAIGVDFIAPTLAETWEDTIGFNPASVVLCGPLSGTGPIVKANDGKLYYCNNASPTFTGGTMIRGGWVDWAPVGLAAAGKFSFGRGPITLDGGYLSFGAAMCQSNACTCDLTNPLLVTALGGRLYYSQEGPAERTPDTHFSGAIDLGGPLIVGHSTAGGTASNVELLGPITVNQRSAATPLISMHDGYRGMLCRGPVKAGPGDAGNPLVLRSDDNPLALLNPGNAFDGLTVIGICGEQACDPFTNTGVVDIAAGSRLGKAGVIIEPGGRLNLNSAGNLPAGATVAVRSNSLVLGMIGTTCNSLPALTADSAGVVAIDCPAFDAVTDLSKLGDGRMWLGSRDHGEFTGAHLAPGVGDVYRLGGGSFGGFAGKGWPKTAIPLQSGAMFGSYLAAHHWLRGNRTCMNAAGNPGSAVGGGLLTIDHGVLVGDAAVDVGSTQWLGNLAVVLEGADTFTGPLRVAGPMQSGFIIGFCGRGSSLEGVEQPGAGQSPFGSPTGSVDLLSSTLKLTAVPGGQAVAKGTLTFAGASTIALDANVDNLASLTLADLARRDRAVLAIDPQQEMLGDKERLLVANWSKDVDLLPPYLLYSSTKDWPIAWDTTGGTITAKAASDRTTGPDFLAYDATGHTGFVRFSHYAADLASAKKADVVRSGPTTLPAGDYTVRALRATGRIAGKDATVHITSGGLILGDDFAPNIDFGAAEGIIYGTDLDTISRSGLYRITGKISGTNGLTLLGGPLPWGFDYSIPATCGTVLANPANDLTGPITIEGDAVLVVPDSIVNGRIVHGSLGDEHNSITLDGGILARFPGGIKNPLLAGTRTIHLAPGGGYFHCERGSWTVDSKITGPGFLGQTTEGGGTLIVTNPANDYTGGTLVGMDIGVAPAGRLGSGPVTMCPDTSLILEGDHNLSPTVRLTASHSSFVSFKSAHPQIGSLDGSGLIWLGSDGNSPAVKLPVSAIDLTIGSDNTDSTFFGAIRQGPGITGSLTKTGAGTFTLFGGHAYTGPTTVDAGALILAGSVAGDVIVNPGATFILKGAVAGNVQVKPGGKFTNQGHVAGKIVPASN